MHHAGRRWVDPMSRMDHRRCVSWRSVDSKWGYDSWAG